MMRALQFVATVFVCLVVGCGSSSDKKGKSKAKPDPNKGLSQYQLGEKYLQGKGVPKDVKKAMGHFKKGCSQGDHTCCSELASIYEFGKGVPESRGQALIYHGKALTAAAKGCKKNDNRACHLEGVSLLNGWANVKNVKRAKAALDKACKLGNKIACRDAKKIPKQ